MTTHNGVLVRKPRTCCGNGGNPQAFSYDFDSTADVCEWGKWPQTFTPHGYAHELEACDFEYATLSPTNFPTWDATSFTGSTPPSSSPTLPHYGSDIVRARGNLAVAAGASFVPEVYNVADMKVRPPPRLHTDPHLFRRYYTLFLILFSGITAGPLFCFTDIHFCNYCSITQYVDIFSGMMLPRTSALIWSVARLGLRTVVRWRSRAQHIRLMLCRSGCVNLEKGPSPSLAPGNFP